MQVECLAYKKLLCLSNFLSLAINQLPKHNANHSMLFSRDIHTFSEIDNTGSIQKSHSKVITACWLRGEEWDGGDFPLPASNVYSVLLGFYNQYVCIICILSFKKETRVHTHTQRHLSLITWISVHFWLQSRKLRAPRHGGSAVKEDHSSFPINCRPRTPGWRGRVLQSSPCQPSGLWPLWRLGRSCGRAKPEECLRLHQFFILLDYNNCEQFVFLISVF